MRKQFICATEERCGFDRPVPAPLFRRSFSLPSVPKKAALSVCGLGFYLLTVNGQDVTKGYFAPYISNPDHILYYDTYNVAPYLKKGENVIGVVLGNGFQNPFGGAVWDFDKVPWISSPKLALSFSARAGEETVSFEADGEFRTAPSPWTFDEYRMGESFDARMKIPGWNLPGFDDAGWNRALKTDPPKGTLRKCEAKPILPRKSLTPVSVTKHGDGYLYDFGENSAGVCLLHLKKPAPGQKITVRFCERLKDGKFDQSNLIFDPSHYPFYLTHFQKIEYFASGNEDGDDSWSQRFSWFGFRYALVEGISESQAVPQLLTFLELSSALNEIGHFHCSDETVNRIYEMVRNSDLSNFYYFPTDCPHREKNGWTGDASFSAPHMTLLYDTASSYREWLRNIVLAQREDGALPGIVPTGGWGFAWGNGPAWDSVLFSLPYVLYRLRGNTDGIQIAGDAMMKYLRYADGRRDGNGLAAFGLGDWVPVGKDASAYETPLEVTDSIVLMNSAWKAYVMLSAVERFEEAGEALLLSRSLRTSVREHLLDRETCVLKGRTQTGQAMGLYYGVFEPDERNRAFAVLLNLIRENGDNFDCGFLGMHCLFSVLSDFGYSELAYRLITKPEFPSYRNLIERGETAIVESFQPEGGRDCGSHNHHFLGDVARWFITDLAGLRVLNSHEIEVCPSFLDELREAEAACRLPAGKVEVRWVRKQRKLHLYVRCPAGVKCRVNLKNARVPVLKRVHIGKRKLKTVLGVRRKKRAKNAKKAAR
ncbi:MAG: family 78 glycoside hydrolase catalytic domain [Clostridia bacterium]|nr:family 78 glycoside hydrolase catalytic domain [Clostridia bacterium]